MNSKCDHQPCIQDGDYTCCHCGEDLLVIENDGSVSALFEGGPYRLEES